MTKTFAQAAAAVLAACMNVAIVAGLNGIAARQYVAAEQVAQATAATTQLAAVQRVVIIGHRAAA